MSTPRSSPRRDATRARLVEAATGVFARKGIEGASVEELCEAAGFTRGAFYSNFASRDELAMAVMRSHADRYLALAESVLPRADQSMGLLAMVRGVIQAIVGGQSDRDQILARMALRTYAAREPRVRDELITMQQTMMSVLGDLLTQTLARQGLRLRVPTTTAVELMSAVYDQSALDALLLDPPSEELPLRRLEALMLGLIVQHADEPPENAPSENAPAAP